MVLLLRKYLLPHKDDSHGTGANFPGRARNHGWLGV